MKQHDQPTMETDRLRLRPLRVTDALQIQEYAGDLRIAEKTCLIPHPYPAGLAEQWISSLEGASNPPFAIALRESDELIGVLGLDPEPNGWTAEMGFWIAVPYWGRGYCTEAAREVLRFGFEVLDLRRIWAGHFAGNEASGRVQQKIGMKKEGYSPWGLFRFGEPRDRVLYGIIRPDWEKMRE